MLDRRERRNRDQEVQRIARILQDAGWFLPAHIPFGILREGAEEIDSSNEPLRRALLLENLVCGIYTPRRLAVSVIRHYPLCPIISDYARQIRECVEASYLGLFNISTMGVIPVIDGVISEIGVAYGIAKSRSKATSRLNSIISHLYKSIPGRRHASVQNEWKTLLGSWKRFFDRRFYRDTLDGRDLVDMLNRHSMVHGLAPGLTVGTRYHFSRLVSVLDVLAQIVCIEPPAGERPASALWPGENEETLAYADHLTGMAWVHASNESSARTFREIGKRLRVSGKM